MFKIGSIMPSQAVTGAVGLPILVVLGAVALSQAVLAQTAQLPAPGQAEETPALADNAASGPSAGAGSELSARAGGETIGEENIRRAVLNAQLEAANKQRDLLKAQIDILNYQAALDAAHAKKDGKAPAGSPPAGNQPIGASSSVSERPAVDQSSNSVTRPSLVVDRIIIDGKTARAVVEDSGRSMTVQVGDKVSSGVVTAISQSGVTIGSKKGAVTHSIETSSPIFVGH